MLPAPRFHHLHLNSVDPGAAIDFYVRQFPCTSRTTWGGESALKSANDVLVLFSKVDRPPPTAPASAFWHFGWHVPDARATLAKFQRRAEVDLQPLYTSDEGASVAISSDTWPGQDGVLGLSKAQIAEARKSGVKPKGGAGFVYLKGGPDYALIEIAGNYPAERFNHVHMWQYDPYCAQLWYQEHLNAPVMEGRTSATPVDESNCKVPRGPDRTWPSLTREGMFRTPRAAVLFGDVALTWYPPQTDQPLVSPRGQLIDHIGLGVADLDAWIGKLRGEGIAITEGPYTLGPTRAVMLEGPSGEVIELVEQSAGA
jgi:catechol 2,3-dioxygenase-like lactoylglutathione lyase family enzyme